MATDMTNLANMANMADMTNMTNTPGFTEINLASYMYIPHHVKKFTGSRKNLLDSVKEIQKGVNSIEGVRGQVYEFPESEEATEQSDVPVHKAQDSTPPDGYLFHLPEKWTNEIMDQAAMLGQFDDFLDTIETATTEAFPRGSNEMDDATKPTGNMHTNKRTQMLAGKPAGIFIDNGKKGGPLDPSTLAFVSQLLRRGMIIVPLSNTNENTAGMFDVNGGSFESEAEAGKYIAEIAKKLKA